MNKKLYDGQTKSSLNYCIASLIFLAYGCACSENVNRSSSTEQNISYTYVDSCTVTPGPDCCALAQNGICEEPFACSLGTDGEDCRGPLAVQLTCEDSYEVEETEAFSTQVLPFVWSDQLNGISFTTEPITLALSSTIKSLSVSIFDGARDTGLNWTLDGEHLRPVNEASAATGLLPYHEDSSPTGGCLMIWPLVEDERFEEEAILLVTARSEEVSDPQLDVNVIIVGDTDVTESELDEALEIAATIFESNQGPSINLNGSFAVEGDSLIPSEGDEINLLRLRTFSDNNRALNLFVIDDFTEGDGTLGIAGGTPAPNGVELTPASGLVVAIEPHLIEDDEGEFELAYALLGSTIAHELGHQLGLDHTTEDDGSTRSAIDDFQSCAYGESGSADPEECPDGQNLMFWSSGDAPQEQLSVEQVFVLNQNPIIY